MAATRWRDKAGTYHTRVLGASDPMGTPVHLLSVLEHAGKIARSGGDMDMISLIDEEGAIIIQLGHHGLSQAEEDEHIVVVSKHSTGRLAINSSACRETSNPRKILTGTQPSPRVLHWSQRQVAVSPE